MEEKLGIEFLAKLAGFEKLFKAAQNVDKLKKSADKATGGISRMNQAFRRMGAMAGRMRDWGGRMMMQTGLVYQAAQDLSRKFYTVVDAFGSVEQKGKELGTVLVPLAGDIRNSINLATQSALDFSKKYSTSATEIMEAQYLIASAGIAQPLITTKAAEWTIKLARATREELSSAAMIWASTANTFFNAAEMTEGEMRRLSDVLTKTQQKFQFENLYQLGDGMKYAGAAARTMHVPIETTATLLGILNTTGIQGTMAGTSLQQTFLKLVKVQKKLKIQLKYTKDGTLDVVDAFRQIKSRIEGLPTAERVRIIQQAFGDRAFKAVMTIIDKLDQVESDLNDVTSAVGVTQKSFEDMEATTNAAFGRMRNNLFRLFYTIGSKLAPTLNKVIERIIRLVNSISEFAEKYPLVAKIAGGFLGIGAAITSIMIPLMTFIGMFAWGAGSIISLAAKMGIQFTSVGSVISGLTTKVLGLKAGVISLTAAAGPLLLIAAGAAAIYGTIKYFDIKRQEQMMKENVIAHQGTAKILQKHQKAILRYRELEEKLLKGIKLTKPEAIEYAGLRRFMETARGGIYAQQIRYKPIFEIAKPGKIPGAPTPEELGMPTPYTITAETRPEINNYYYTIHYERDSIQVNALELTPEKLEKVLDQLNRRYTLAPVTP